MFPHMWTATSMEERFFAFYRHLWTKASRLAPSAEDHAANLANILINSRAEYPSFESIQCVRRVFIRNYIHLVKPLFGIASTNNSCSLTLNWRQQDRNTKRHGKEMFQRLNHWPHASRMGDDDTRNSEMDYAEYTIRFIFQLFRVYHLFRSIEDNLFDHHFSSFEESQNGLIHG